MWQTQALRFQQISSMRGFEITGTTLPGLLQKTAQNPPSKKYLFI
jgi:hypothetical protein